MPVHALTQEMLERREAESKQLARLVERICRADESALASLFDRMADRMFFAGRWNREEPLMIAEEVVARAVQSDLVAIRNL